MSRKNVRDSLIDTLFNIKGKTKDDLKCHQDLVNMSIRDQLHKETLQISRALYLLVISNWLA